MSRLKKDHSRLYRMRSYSGWRPLLWLPLLLLLPCVMLVGCLGDRKSKKMSRQISLWRNDKRPYGTYVAYQNLGHLFPDATIRLNRGPISALAAGYGKKAFIVITNEMDPDGADINSLLSFVGQGNHVFISSFSFGDSLLHALNIRAANNTYVRMKNDSLQVSVYAPVTSDSLHFAYPGFGYDDWVSSIDSQYSTILGRDSRGRPDFLRFNYKGGGSLMIHFAPLAFSNFFLLHKDNMRYYDNVLSYIPQTVSDVIWDEHLRYVKDTSFSALGYIFRNPPLLWAFMLLLLLFAIIYLFESKRRQRVVPVIGALQNSSLDFVKTIGRLYYQRRDNRNLVEKMAAHFQDHIRTHYNLTNPIFEEGMAEKLAFRTGIPKDTLRSLIGEMGLLMVQDAVSDQELLAFNRKMEEFYKRA